MAQEDLAAAEPAAQKTDVDEVVVHVNVPLYGAGGQYLRTVPHVFSLRTIKEDLTIPDPVKVKIRDGIRALMKLAGRLP